MLANPSSLHTRPYSPHSSHFSLSNNRCKLSLSPNCPRLINSTNSSKFRSLSLLLSRRKCTRTFTVKALSTEPESADAAPTFSEPVSVKIPFGDRDILVETGYMGRQASGSVTVTDGETIVYTSVCLVDVPTAGRTSGGFFKREGRTKDHEVLVCRLIDRPLRPTMLKGFYHETQILSWVLSYDGLHSPDALAITTAGIAVALSEVPHSKTIAGVRVGLVGDKFVVNPTTKEMEDSELDLLLAGSDNAILMIEGYCNFLSEEKLLQAVQVGQDAVLAICHAVEALVKKCGKPKMLDSVKLPPPELYKHVEEIAGEELVQVLQIRNKIPRRKALSSLEEKVLTILTEKGYVSKDETLGTAEIIPDLFEDEDEDDEVVVDGEVDEGDVHIRPIPWKPTPLLFSEVDVKIVFKEVTSKFLRRRIVEGGKRSDGRYADGIRPINSRCGLLPRAHGSALFTRGETQSLAVVTLGDKQMAQRIDNLVDDDDVKRFYLQYSFPPSCVGEVGRIGAPSRREIGHGTLAERALEPILPSDDDFPYTVRVESTITESNGSSSMASVCGGCLALQDAGVPLKCSIAGIAMGLVLDTEEFGGDGTPLILSDITGSEDASGDMDFKVAGNEDGITAFQMDIKVGGITLPVMRKALQQAKDGRRHILAEMLKCSPPPSNRLSTYAPLIHIMKVHPEKINLIIGSGGKKVKGIIEETGVEAIDTEDDGTVKITARDLSSLEKCKAIISNLTMVPTVGDIIGISFVGYLSHFPPNISPIKQRKFNSKACIHHYPAKEMFYNHALGIPPNNGNCEIKSIAPYGVFVEIAPGREGLCHISELSSNWLAKAEEVVKVGDRVDVKLIEVNDKGQLRLSRKALLPETDDGAAEEKIEQPKDKVGTPKFESSPRSNSQEGTLLPQKKVKVFKRVASPAKEGPYINKERTKKSGSKAVSSISSKDRSSLVDGEAKIG
ncbi:hypothetical protein LWI28_013516 [Acer negundo]|uniref:polyribonucleotide nucleotidyltransferase n=1 Tax=Acer negundo TaxID=4023 RepID=A0AAD5J4M1_ACENE|nr:hypothetical protein LWI28_013516 [Acer negundo]